MTTVMASCFVALFLASAVSLIWSKVALWLKTVLILTTIVVCAGLWISINKERGLPQTKPMPNPFLLAYTMVRSPNAREKDPGAVFYVIVAEQHGRATPVVYSRPYSPAEHRKANEAQNHLDQKGSPVWFKEESGSAESSSREDAHKGLLERAAQAVMDMFGNREDTSTMEISPMNTSPQDRKRSINTTP